MSTPTWFLAFYNEIDYALNNFDSHEVDWSEPLRSLNMKFEIKNCCVVSNEGMKVFIFKFFLSFIFYIDFMFHCSSI